MISRKYKLEKSTSGQNKLKLPPKTFFFVQDGTGNLLVSNKSVVKCFTYL